MVENSSKQENFIREGCKIAVKVTANQNFTASILQIPSQNVFALVI
jgi:hypothetical protein